MYILLIAEFVQKTYEKDEVKVKDHDHMITSPENIEDSRIKNIIYI